MLSAPVLCRSSAPSLSVQAGWQLWHRVNVVLQERSSSSGRRREEGRKGRMNDAISLPVQSQDGLALPSSSDVTCFFRGRGRGCGQGNKGYGGNTGFHHKMRKQVLNHSDHHLTEFREDMIVPLMCTVAP